MEDKLEGQTRPSRKRAALVRKNSPPIRTKSTRYTTKLSLRAPDVQQAEVVAQQQSLEFIDLARMQYRLGVLHDAALRPPGKDGKYGLYAGEYLAQQVRADVDGLNSFLLSQGIVPAIVQEYRLIVQGLQEAIQRFAVAPAAMTASLPTSSSQPPPEEKEPSAAPETQVAEEALDVLSMFGLTNT
jgi:hypothetical protein